jgi:hypothetical protein
MKRDADAKKFGWRVRRGLPELFTLFSLIALLGLQPVQAHLMVAQRGTLNFVGTGGFVVMAVPVDSLTGVDDDGDGLMSMAEMKAHGSAIETQVQRGLQLSDAAGARPLQALLLNLSPDDSTPLAPAAHIVVLGRFALPEVDGKPLPTSGLTLRFTLFGKKAASQKQSILITQGALKQQLVLSPNKPDGTLFPSAWVLLRDNAVLGAEHVLSGLDHLLFLLVVLATGWSFRQTVLALTCFTLGHGITLAASALGGWTVPSAVVEPAIAATIIGMVLFDMWSKRRPKPWPAALRLSLVFVCALIHGLGFAGGLTDLGLDTRHRLLSLAGFNLGIEAGQLLVAVLAIAVMAGVKRFKGTQGVTLTTRFASYAALAAGSFWLAQRMLFTV